MSSRAEGESKWDRNDYWIIYVCADEGRPVTPNVDDLLCPKCGAKTLRAEVVPRAALEDDPRVEQLVVQRDKAVSSLLAAQEERDKFDDEAERLGLAKEEYRKQAEEAQERAQEAEQAARFEKVAAKDAEHLAAQALTLRARAEAALKRAEEAERRRDESISNHFDLGLEMARQTNAAEKRAEVAEEALEAIAEFRWNSKPYQYGLRTNVTAEAFARAALQGREGE